MPLGCSFGQPHQASCFIFCYPNAFNVKRGQIVHSIRMALVSSKLKPIQANIRLIGIKE